MYPWMISVFMFWQVHLSSELDKYICLILETENVMSVDECGKVFVINTFIHSTKRLNVSYNIIT